VPITPTYPGVYIEELPSTVHTIVGVATSVTAFVGYTKRGPANRPTEVFSYGDFERAFGGLDPDCPLTYAVQQFFLNGGSDAWIVRVAKGAKPASVALGEAAASGHTVLTLTAKSSGVWANSLRINVDRDTLNPDSLFNVTVTEYVTSNGVLVASASESMRNLTMNRFAPTYAVDVINDHSQLVEAARPTSWPPVAFTTGDAGTSQSGGTLTGSTATIASGRLTISHNGEAPVEVTGIAAASGVTAIVAALNTAIAASTLGGLVDATAVSTSGIVLTDKVTPVTERSSIQVLPASLNDVAPALHLGLANGGTERDAVAKFNPFPTGTVGNDLDASLPSPLPAGLSATSDLKFVATVNVSGTNHATAPLTLLKQNEAFNTKEELRAGLQTALQAAAAANPDIQAELAGTTVAIADNRLVVSAGGRADTSIALSKPTGDATADRIGFPGSGTVPVPNVAAYSPASGGPRLAQMAGANGSDGAPATATEIIGDDDKAEGIYALKHVDLFNLLVLPDDAAANSQTVVSTAMSYCENRRAFLIVDLPTAITTREAAQDWISDPATPKSANSAAYFPRLMVPDPMQGYRARPMGSAGIVAGLYARIDSSRGVWKAPAGTEATLRGPTGVSVPLNDLEQGTLNPLGLNATRALPVYGNVVWGARTLNGADQLGSQWKYIPVRRLALYIEESLFRGTKWAVFEPNDEPLWAQIRLSVGSFMHNLFRQHAFEGSAPRQAYLVKCDSETTTQADIDLGIVNIIVGFAPLKPAEFVVIQITQLAGQLDV
jgi:phage tail sheath protein FI